MINFEDLNYQDEDMMFEYYIQQRILKLKEYEELVNLKGCPEIKLCYDDLMSGNRK